MRIIISLFFVTTFFVKCNKSKSISNMDTIQNENKSNDFIDFFMEDEKLVDACLEEMKTELEMEYFQHFNFDNYVELLKAILSKVKNFRHEDLSIIEKVKNSMKSGYQSYYLEKTPDATDIFKLKYRNKPWLILYKDLMTLGNEGSVLEVFYEMLIASYIAPNVGTGKINKKLVQQIKELDFTGFYNNFESFFNYRLRQNTIKVNYPFEIAKHNKFLKYESLCPSFNQRDINAGIKKYFFKYDKYCSLQCARLYGIKEKQLLLEYKKLNFYFDVRSYLINKCFKMNKVSIDKKLIWSDKILLGIIASDIEYYLVFTDENHKYRHIYDFLTDLKRYLVENVQSSR